MRVNPLAARNQPYRCVVVSLEVATYRIEDMPEFSDQH